MADGGERFIEFGDPQAISTDLNTILVGASRSPRNCTQALAEKAMKAFHGVNGTCMVPMR